MRIVVITVTALAGFAVAAAWPVRASEPAPAPGSEAASGAVMVLMPGSPSEHVIPMASMDACRRAVAHTSRALCMDAKAAEAYFAKRDLDGFSTATGR